MRLRHSLWLAAIAALMAAAAQARPVTYAGGTGIMAMNDGTSHSLHVTYSPAWNYSVGLKSEYWREKDWWFNGVELDYLAKRWNQSDSQANIYLKTAAGTAYSDAGAFDGTTQLSGFVGFAADWETRRYFTSYENRVVEAGDIDRFFMQSARLGIAPYVGESGDLHTWLMLEATHMPESDDALVFTPMLRLFQGSHLVEAGISTRGDILFNYVTQF